MAALLESDVKRVLAAHGLRVPRGRACTTPDEVVIAAQQIGGPLVVKALVPAKGKALAGGIAFAADHREARAAAERLLGHAIAGFEVREVLVESREAIASEIYVGIALDGASRSYRLTVAPNGGTGVEDQLARGAAASLHFRPGGLPWPHEVRALLARCGLRNDALRALPDALRQLCRIVVAFDLLLLEVNPMALHADGTPCVIGVLAAIDESALARQPDLGGRAIAHVDQLLRPRTSWERAFDDLNGALPDGGDIRFGEFPGGDLGMMVLGGGAGLLALDAVARAGGMPANFLDMTSAAGQAEEKVRRATRLFLDRPHLRGLFIGSNIGAFLPVPIRMRGIAAAVREGLPRSRFPVVVRLAGIADDEVEPIVAGLPVTYLRDEVTLEAAAGIFMQQLEAAP